MAVIALLAWAFRDLAPFLARQAQATLTEHGLPPALIVGASAALLIGRLARVRPVPSSRGGIRAGSAVLMLSALTVGWARHVSAPDLLLIALGLAVSGFGLLRGGTALAREIMGPLAILAFALPWPGPLYNATVWGLQQASTGLAHDLLVAAGIPAEREGITLLLPGSSLLMIESCSGLSSIQVLTSVAAAYACQARLPGLRALILVLAAPAVAFFTNGARIATMAALAAPIPGADHSGLGVVAMGVGVALLLVLDATLAALMRSRRPSTTPAAGGQAEGGEARWSAAILWAAVLAAISLVPRYDASRSRIPWSARLPGAFEATAPRPREPDLQFQGAISFDWHLDHYYGPASNPVDLLLGHADLSRRDRSLISPRHAFPGPAWEIETRDEIDASGLAFERSVSRSGTQRRMTLLAYRGVGSLAYETVRSLLALDQSALLRTEGVQVLKVSAAVPGSPNGLREAEDRLRALVAAVALQLTQPPTSPRASTHE